MDRHDLTCVGAGVEIPLSLRQGERSLRVRVREPMPADGAPWIPPGVELDEIAQRQWDELSRILSNMRVLTEADGLILAALCQTFSRWVAASNQLQRTGLL